MCVWKQGRKQRSRDWATMTGLLRDNTKTATGRPDFFFSTLGGCLFFCDKVTRIIVYITSGGGVKKLKFIF